jgi:hypothetical protein
MREDYGKYACHASSIKGAAEKIIEISGMPQRLQTEEIPLKIGG